MDGKTRFVHRMVLEVFVGPSNGLECRHINGDKTDNRLENLSWGTTLENAMDRKSHGTARGGSMPGCSHPNSKISKEQVVEIFTSPLPTRAVARKVGVAQRTAQLIRRRLSYTKETEGLQSQSAGPCIDALLFGREIVRQSARRV